MSVTSQQLKEEWTHDLAHVRQGRALQRQIAEYGIHYPLLDLLVMRGHLRREVAQRALPADHVFPSDLPFRRPEAEVLARAQAAGKVSETQSTAGQAIVRSIAMLGVPVTLSFVFVQLKYLRWKDLLEMDRRLEAAAGEALAGRLEDADTRERPAVGAPALEDMETRERSLADLGHVRLDEGTRRRAEMRLRLMGIPEAELRAILIETRLIPESDLEGPATPATGDPTAPTLVDVLLQRGVLTTQVAEVLVETYQKRRRKS